VVVTAGPTREFFDPVRFLSNPSTGKMGYALAEAALKKGARVILISGPTNLDPPKKAVVIHVTSAQEMYQRVMQTTPKANIVIMTAAVSDYRPEKKLSHKMKKTGKAMKLALVPNPDILATLGRKKKKGQILVGFAAETQNLVKNALSKLHKKNLDFIVANQVGQQTSGFATDQNKAVILWSEGQKEFPRMTKKELASKILEIIIKNH